MDFDWRKYLSLARFLKEKYQSFNLNEQSVFRSSISRAYYAAFNHTCEYAEKNLEFQSEKSGEDHRRIRKHLKAKNRVPEARKLERLRKWRVSSDYDKNFVISEKQVEHSINMTEEIFKTFCL